MKHLQIDKWDKAYRRLAESRCHICDGFGIIIEHACKGNEKLCQIKCPIQEQCSWCMGTGKKNDGK